MQTLSLSPLFRSTIGFDRFEDLFESLTENDQGNISYPPYNIEKHGDDRYVITMAVAGFRENDLNITLQNDQITVSGRKERDGDSEDVEYLYNGIASRAFERTFRLADHMKVTGAELEDGLLRIGLVRDIPEEQKPRMIRINTSGNRRTIEHSSDTDKEKAA